LRDNIAVAKKLDNKRNTHNARKGAQ